MWNGARVLSLGGRGGQYLEATNLLVHPFQAVNVGIAGFIPWWVLMTKRRDNFLRETPLKRVPLYAIVDPQDGGKLGKVGVVA